MGWLTDCTRCVCAIRQTGKQIPSAGNARNGKNTQTREISERESLWARPTLLSRPRPCI